MDLRPFVAGLRFYCSTFLLVIGCSTVATNAGEALVRNTVRVSLAWYLVAMLVMLAFREPADWQISRRPARFARRCWTWAVISFLVHLGMAFHYYHQWSHAHAFERTREVSGVGEGIYVSYAFTLVWCGDLLWWWLSPTSYAMRRRWIRWSIHAFLLFIIINGTVVFEAGGIRWAGLVGLVVLMGRFLASKTSRPSSQASQPSVAASSTPANLTEPPAAGVSTATSRHLPA